MSEVPPCDASKNFCSIDDIISVCTKAALDLDTKTECWFFEYNNQATNCTFLQMDDFCTNQKAQDDARKRGRQHAVY